MSAILERAARKREVAERILGELDLLARWRRFGRPVLVGAVAYDLVAVPDIDMEVYCRELRIEDGFEVLRACALHPRVTGAQFVNALATPDKALYWQLRYKDEDGEEWKIDMWSAPEDYPLPRAETIVEPLKAALTDETREAILTLKEQRAEDASLACLSIDLYRAVLDGGVRTASELRAWLARNETGVLTAWKPNPRR